MPKVVVTSILFCFYAIELSFAQTPLVTNDGLALTIQSGLIATAQGGYTNKTNGATLTLGTIDNGGIFTLTGDWTNNSANTVFSTNTGLIQFIGSTAGQIIGGSNSTGFYNLTINNTFVTIPQITLGVNTVAKNNLAMTKGNINLSTKTLTLGTAPGTPGTLTHDSTFVSSGWMYGGSFTRWFATSIIPDRTITSGLFPFGNSGIDHRPFYVSCPVTAPASGGTITLLNTIPNADILTVTNVSFPDAANTVIRRHDYLWVVTTGDGMAGGTYNLSAGGTSFGQIGAVVDLRLTQVASCILGVAGVNAGTTTDPIVNRSGLTFANLSTDFYIGSISSNSPLPIELRSFDAKPNKEVVDLLWTTFSEKNNDFFTIEKTVDGTNFEQVEKVKGAGNSTSVLNYSTKDVQPYEGISYYRLKQTDYNGNYTYSNLVSVEFKNNLEILFNIYPNPNEGSSINLSLNTTKGEEILVIVYDITGKESYSRVIITEDKGEHVCAIDPSQKLLPGVYLITGTTNQKIYSKKLIVK